MASEYDLLVEVHVKTDDDQHENFTGYPVAPGRVLTARHGLLPEVHASKKQIEVRWHHQKGGKRKWRKAKIEWQDEKLDAAVLSCRFPPGVEGFGLVSDQAPRAHLLWDGTGIPRAGDKSAEASGPFSFLGKVMSAQSDAFRFQIGIDYEVSDPEWYEGASGMAVFVDHRILGIALSTGGPARARQFLASPTRLMLANEKFCKAIGRDERDKYEQRRQDAVDAVAQLLSPAHADPLRRQLARHLGVKSLEPEGLAAALIGSDLDAALLALYQALDAVGPGENDRNRTLVCGLLGQILPVRFDAGAIEGTVKRCDRPGALCLDLPAGIETVAEVIMAGVRARPAQFKDLKSRNLYPVGRDALSSPPYTGFDSDGKAFERNVDADLCNRLLDGDEDSFDTFMIREFIPEREGYRRSGMREEELQAAVADELTTRHRLRRRRYYFVLDPGIGAAQANALPALENLKSRYRLLDFAVLGNAGDGNVIRKERRRFAVLREILPSAEENPR